MKQRITLSKFFLTRMAAGAMLIALEAFIARAAPHVALASGLDLTFSGDGRLIDSFHGNGNDAADGVALQADGKIVVVGFSEYGFVNGCSVSRFNPNGSLDASFGEGGRVLIPPLAAGSDACIDVAIQSDGKIVLAGNSSRDANGYDVDFALVRLNPDGSFDLSFGGSGRITTAFSNIRDSANAVVIQPDGKIVAAGSANNVAATSSSDFALARYHPDGSLDTSFDGDGKRVTPTQSTADGVTDLALQSDGRIVAVGTANSTSIFTADLAVARYNSDGSLDDSFGGTGLVTTQGAGVPFAMAIQADGKIVAAGESFNGSVDFTLARYNTNGSLDNSFDGDGVVTTSVLSTGDGARGVALQADGKIVAAGYGFRGLNTYDAVFVRYNPNGSLDSSFNGTGKVTAPLTTASGLHGVVIQSDGKIIGPGAALNGADADVVLVRYGGNGLIDTSFDTDGVAYADIGQAIAIARGVAVQADGKIIAAGYASNGANTDFALTRYHPDGTPDTSFGGTGKVMTPILNRFDYIKAVAVQADGKIVAVGSAQPSAGEVFALARYHADGSLDTSFGGTGKVTTAFPRSVGANAAAIQPDGKIVATGTILGSENTDFAVARYNLDGSLDNSFGGTGKITTQVLSSYDYANAIVAQPDGKIVVAGYADAGSFDYDVVVVRYNQDGSLDTSFDGDGKATTPLAGKEDEIYAVALQADGRIVVAGSTLNGATRDFALVRFNPDGSLDTSFGGTGKVITPVLADDDIVHAIAIQADGKILVTGDAYTGESRDFALVRYNADGSLDNSYGAGGKLTFTFDETNVHVEEIPHGLALDANGSAVVAGYSRGFFAVARVLSGGVAAPAQLLNIATRMRVLTGDSALIGGFIITGSESKRVIIRGIGPSLGGLGVPGALANPTLDLFNSSQTLLATSDDWKSNQAEVEATTIPPSHDLESAIVMTLAPGAYTAVLRGKDNSSGIGVVEVYDLNANVNAILANISSRGFVDTGDNVMIGGFIIGGSGQTNARVAIRGIGPSLSAFGITGALQDPMIELKDVNGTTIISNDDWQQGQPAEINQLNLAPGDSRESAIVASLPQGNFTAVLRGKDNSTGVAVVEVYNVE